jgi:hypothetical protein
MKRIETDGWMDKLLMLLLTDRNHETVSGDLLEEKAAKAREIGCFRARVWYVWQILSFLPERLTSAFANDKALAFLSGFTALSGLWLGVMDLRLRHPGYAGREIIAGIIVFQGLLTLTALFLRVPLLRKLALLGTAAIFWLAGKALFGLLYGSHFEGYILLIALGLAVQAVLTWFTVPQWRHRARKI